MPVALSRWPITGVSGERRRVRSWSRRHGARGGFDRLANGHAPACAPPTETHCRHRTIASSDVRESLADAAERLQDSPLIIGVKVVNAGREPFHVAGWAIRADPDGTSLVPIEKPIAGADVPHDIPPGGSAVFLTELQHAHRFADAAAGTEGEPRLVLTVSSGARTYATKPIAPELVSLDQG
jgi:hypothetical protein